MSDVVYEFGDVPNRYQDVIQRMTTLIPLRGVPNGDAGVREATEKLLLQWRARIGNLVTAGWELSQGQRRAEHSIIYARNCKPTFAMTAYRLRPCNNRLICPFCYARWTRDVWLNIDANFPAPDPVEGITDEETGRELRPIMLDRDVEDAVENHTTVFRFHLVERHHTFYRPVVGNNTTLAQTLAGLLHDIERQRQNVVRLVDPVGAFIYTTLEPNEDGTQWKIHHRQLYKMIPEQDFPESLAEGTQGSVARFERPTRRVILSAVARACRYPTQLMIGDAERTVQLLDIRRRSNFRAHARFRGFRRSRYE